MTHQSAYKVDSFAANRDAEIRRLNAQVDLFWPFEGELLMRYGLRDGMHVLDCGCGPGRLIELMKRRLPQLCCKGVEIDEVLVQAGQRHIEQSGLPDCSIQQGSAEEPGLPNETFDFITMRLVLEHVSDPTIPLRSLGALLKPGGRLVVISNDFDFHLRTFPEVKELDLLYNAYIAARRRDGGDPCIGRRVPHLMLEVGLKLVGNEIELAHNALIGDGPFLRAEGAGIPAQLVKTGFLDAQVLDAMSKSWRAMLEEPTHSIARPLWVAVAERGDRWSPNDTVPRSGTIKHAEADARASVSKPTYTQERLLENVLALAASTLNVPKVDASDSLVALGIDSIAALNLQQGIKDLAGVELPIVRFFEDQPIQDLLVGLTQVVVDAPEEAADEEWEEGQI